ncbi:IPT/TIG domain-containing protein [Cesiribacter sp. SM1]|uniref:IPT/TIG domain-containing protein n=1 Tax=Cesiribacter sp. SM1 TaxID=2861196 RepID=UPI001CD79BF7|nr:IPT/TIG domain-containing protein [Cesiribacter sp. SM1]
MISKLSKGFLLLAVLFITLIRCNEDEVTPRHYPRLNTLSVKNVTQNGATLEAEIAHAGNSPILDHGFLWGLNEGLSTRQSDKISLGAFSGKGNFNAQVSSSLYKDSTYFVKAYAITREHIIYGDAVQFSSRGSIAPVIEGFTPETATSGDTVKIRGKYFSFVKLNNQVSFGERSAKIVASTDTLITCIVPHGISQNTVPVSVKVAGNTTTAANALTMLVPKIDSFSPAEGTFGTIVTLNGANFSTKSAENIVKFGEHEAQVIEASATRLKVVVPATVSSKGPVITVTVHLMTGAATEPFNMLPPNITSVSSEKGFTGNSITLRGNNFNPIPEGNKVLFGYLYGTVTNASATELEVTIPEGMYVSRSFYLDVEVAEQHTLSTKEFTLLDPWIKKEDVPHGPYGRYWAIGFAVSGHGYAGIGRGNDLNSANRDFWKYTPQTNKWEKMADFGGGERFGATSFTIGNYAYVGGGYSESGLSEPATDFWRYDPATNTWQQIASIEETSLRSVGLSANGKGYVINIGGSIYEYDPTSDSWSYFSSIASGLGYRGRVSAGFVIGNKMYLLSSQSTTAPHELFELDLNTRQWTSKASLREYFSKWNNNGFEINGKGYLMTSYSFYEYDPARDSFTEISSRQKYDREGGISFVVDNKAYYGGGTINGSYSVVDFWEFDPTYK